MANWKATLEVRDVFDNEDLTFEQRRDAIVSRIRAAEWFKTAAADEDDGYEITDIVADLADSKGSDTFDSAWEALYDWADTDHRVWVNS